jgi:glycosyltransferase involved in cell wall biosynthesis
MPSTHPRKVTFAIPGDLATPTGGYGYAREVIAALRARGWTVDILDLGDGFPRVDVDQRAHARLKTRHVITTDHSTAATLAADYAVPPAHISVARPGTRRMSCPQTRREGPVRILAVGAIVPRKGYDLLVRALAELRDLDWHLTIVGDRTRGAEAVAGLDRFINSFGLSQQITCTGTVSSEQLDLLHQDTDLFVQFSWFEGYGMALADAIAYGLPVIATQTGAAPRIVAPEAGLLVPPGDHVALMRALRLLIGDAALRERYAAAARMSAQNLPTWDETAQVFEQVLSKL